jgi:formylglycine-generating enzyme required for sulfatase activity
MSSLTSRRTACPRCDTPVAGDFKFCPACAYRLRPGEVPAPAPAEPLPRWPYLVLLTGAGLLVAGLLLAGFVLFRERPREPALLPPAVGEILTVRGHLLQQMVVLTSGVAFNWPDEEASEGELPLRVGQTSFMRTEVTRGMYAECLHDYEANPEKVSRLLHEIWRPAERDAAGYALALEYAETHVAIWRDAVERHLGLELGRPYRCPADLRAPVPASYGILLMVPPSWTYLNEFEELRWRMPEGTENLPVAEVSFHDAVAFAEWAGQELGEALRLPLETEWIRAGHGTHVDWRYPWGNLALVYACNNLNYWGPRDFPRLRPVDYPYSDADGSTDEGLWGMSGNAREWADNWDPRKIDNGTPDDFEDDFYQANYDREVEGVVATAPTMGGSFRYGIQDCTIGFGVREDKRARRDDLGFRLMRQVPGIR